MIDQGNPGRRTTDVVVVGGGVAGLVAARDCARIGLRVVVIEATDAVGGAVGRHDVAGLRLDSGAESFAVRRGSVGDYLDELGLAGEVVEPDPAGAWLYLPSERPGGEPVAVPLPKAGVLGIPGSPLADDVRRVIGWAGAWRAWLDRVLPVLTIGREHSLGGLVRKRMGRRVLERLVEPVASGVYSAAADDLEVDVVAPGLNSALTTMGSLSGAVLSLRSVAPAGSAVGGIRGGMSRLVDALVADLELFGVDVRTGTRVTAVVQAGGEEAAAWTVTLETPGSGADRPADASGGVDAADGHADADAVSAAAEDADAIAGVDAEVVPGAPAARIPPHQQIAARFVIIATPAAQALELLAPIGAPTAALSELAWPEPTVVQLATLVVDAPALDAHPRGTGVLVAASTPGVTAKALTHVSAKWGWVADAAEPGRHVLRLSFGRAGAPVPAAALDDGAFRALALADASRLLGVELSPDAVRGFARTTWRDALAPSTIGARERVEAVREAVGAVPGIEVTGGWLAGTGLASVIPDARAAASRIRRAALAS